MGADLPKLDDSQPAEDSEEEDEESSDDDKPIARPRKVSKPKKKAKWEETVLKDLGITLNFTLEEDAIAVKECLIKRWSVEDRDKRSDEISLGKEEFVASEIFEVTGSKLNLKENVRVTVNLKKSISKRHKVKVKLMKDKKWVKEDAEVKKGKAVFVTKQVEHFYVVGDIVKKKFKVPPEGKKIRVDETSKMEVDIPAGAVDADQDVNFQIIPPDTSAIEKYLRGQNPVCKSIVGVTECMYGDNAEAAGSGLSFKKPVTVKLPFEEKSKNKDTSLVLFRMVGKEIKIMERSTKFDLSKDNVCSMQVSAFSGYFAGYVRNECLMDTRSIESESRLLFGKNYLATILVFRLRGRMSTGLPKIWLEIVDKVNVERTVRKREEMEGMSELPNSRSQDIKVDDGYRLKIEITGNLRGIKDIPKSYYTITYLDVADDNHKAFTVEMKTEERNKIGIVNFYSEKGNKECLHSVQIDMDTLLKDPDQLARPRKSVSIDDGSSIRSGSTGYATRASFSNESVYDQRPPLTRQDSIGSATTLIQQDALCPALNESSLFNLAAMVKEQEAVKLASSLGMKQDFEVISQGSQSLRAAVFKMLKDWRQKQTTKQKAVDQLQKSLQAAKMKKAVDAFTSAVKKDAEV